MMKKIMLSLVVLMFVVSGMMKAQTNTKMITYYDPEEKIAYYVVWDTKTGNNLQYYWAGDKWDTMAFNIPSPPLLDTIKGDIMFDVYYDTKVKRAFYTIWDTKTGRNIQYLWDQGQWSEMKYNLPQQPFEGAKGDIMLTSYYSESEGKAFYTFYDAAGGKSVQYFWADDHWTDMRLNLPEKPLAKWRPSTPTPIIKMPEVISVAIQTDSIFVSDLIQGKWQSMDDKTNFLMFDKNQRSESTDKMKTWDKEAFVLSNKCLNESGKKNALELEKYNYVSCIKSDLCWYIASVNADFLTLTYMGRGNTLKYKRVK